ncbi:MAG: prolipoprotein diacylglyceryl transferase family protein [Christensenellales bacterium]
MLSDNFDKTKLPAKIYNYYSMNAVISIAAGLLSAMLFQSVYNYFETGVFKLEGMTFMGGLIGGAGTFVVVTLFAKSREVKRSFFAVAEIAAPCVCLAHALGRIGCTLAGCCYGIDSEHGWFFLRRQKLFRRSSSKRAFVRRLSRLYDKTTSARIQPYRLLSRVRRIQIHDRIFPAAIREARL